MKQLIYDIQHVPDRQGWVINIGSKGLKRSNVDVFKMVRGKRIYNQYKKNMDRIITDLHFS